MTRSRELPRPTVITLLATLALALVGVLGSTPAHAATLSVAEAIATQDSSTATVRGYVVGQPTAEDTVVTDGFPDDYALAIADSAGETDTDEMLYVQVTSEHRAEWGLASNPDLMGSRIDVTGDLTPYFTPHAGLKDPSSLELVGEEPTDPPTEEPTDPPTEEPTDPSDPGEVPAGYYDSAEGLAGQELEAALHDIIDDHTMIDYDAVWDALRETDADPASPGNVVELYSRRSVPADSNGGDADDWNREHVWAKSHGDFGTSMGPGTDVHHLRPTDVSVNSARGNLDFDLGGSGVEECTGCMADEDSFEPPDEVKGDVARMLFYMSVRYEGDDGFPDLEVNDQVGNGSAPYHGRLSVLLEWHQEDPVSDAERMRNDLIYSNWQGNRNPFIDHPEWAAEIW
ncbi:endonuclease [Georgenia alba]|uniref:Endonuclease n=1 Tax=Georgenia alba TaxID=2233858 RepID=A0ABW2QCI1_9MICO